MIIYVATVRNAKNDRLILEGYRNRKVDGNWKKEYASCTIKDTGLDRAFYIGSKLDVVWDKENKCFKEK